MNIFFNILQKNIKYTGPLQVLKNKDSNRENDFDLEKYKKRKGKELLTSGFSRVKT